MQDMYSAFIDIIHVHVHVHVCTTCMCIIHIRTSWAEDELWILWEGIPQGDVEACSSTYVVYHIRST